MAAVKLLLVAGLALLVTGCMPQLDAIAVEYELDGPLDLKQKWEFVRDTNFFIQHQCGPERGKAWALKINQLFEKQTLLRQTTEAADHLQIRLFAGLGAYRKAFRFSRERQAHYNGRLKLIVSYCGAAAAIVEEQLILHMLSHAQLRAWQNFFLAETLPYLENTGQPPGFADAAKQKPKPLQQVLLSNHRPDREERATLRALTLFLFKEKKLRFFCEALLRWRGFDDTGIEILEDMFSGGIQALEKQITPVNNTLPGRK